MKPLYTRIKVTDKTQTQKLHIMDQLKLLLGKVSNDDTIKLEASEKISRANLEMQSALSNLVDSSVQMMKDRAQGSVTLSVSSRFKPYFKEVLSKDSGKGRFYDFEIYDKGSSVIGVDYFINMRIKSKED